MIETNARNATLDDLAGLLRVQHDAKIDAIVPATAIESVNGSLLINGTGPDGPAGKAGVYRPTEILDGHLADKLGIPLKYVRRLRSEHPALYDANINGWLHGDPHQGTKAEGTHSERGPDNRRFLFRGFVDTESYGEGVGRALMSDGYKLIDNLDVLTAALDAIREVGDTRIEIDSCDLSERRMQVKIVAPDIQLWAEGLFKGYRNPFNDPDVRRAGWTYDRARQAAQAEGQYEEDEPVVEAGFALGNSETGNGAFSLVPRFRFRICRNGLTIGGDAIKQVHLGSRMDEGVVNWSEETMQRNLALVKSQTADAVRTFLDVEYMRGKIAEVTAKAEKKLDDPNKTIELVANQLRYTDTETDGILKHFIMGGQMTAGGVMQAVTSFAQTVDDPDQAYDLENSAMSALELAAR